MKWIIKNTGKYLWAVAFLCMMVILLTLAGVVQALAMRNFLDFAAEGDKAGFLRWFAIFFGLIFFSACRGSGEKSFHSGSICFVVQSSYE